MAFVTFVRRFRRIPSQFFLPYTSKQSSTLPQNPPPSSSSQTHFFSRAFRRTRTIHSKTTPEIPNSSTFPAPHSDILHKPITVDRYIHDHDVRNQSRVAELVNLLKNSHDFPSEHEAMAFLDESGVKPTEVLINSTIWGLKDEWKLAYSVFKWVEKWGCNGDKNWSLIIWILGSHKKFNTAWCLIRDLHRSSMDTKQAMLIMIDRYTAANDPSKAIQTFQVMEKFSMTPDLEAYYTLLNSLCKNGNVEEAEEFMYLNKKLFPLESEGFNVILNGWCNISIDVYEAKRVWREMSKNCIVPNATSYTHMISCFSKVGNLFDSLRLYDEMKKRGWVPVLEVYNSLIHVLTRENCLNEALKIVDKIKENSLEPNSDTYNSIISPLCKSLKFEEARNVLAKMIEDNVGPDIETYHAFLEGASLEGTFEVLNRMEKTGLGPKKETFVVILVKFFKLNEPENALKIWVEMNRYNVVHDSIHYKIVVEGLVKCGYLLKAKEFYVEMKFNGINGDPKLEKLLKEQIGDGRSKSSAVKDESSKKINGRNFVY